MSTVKKIGVSPKALMNAIAVILYAHRREGENWEITKKLLRDTIDLNDPYPKANFVEHLPLNCISFALSTCTEMRCRRICTHTVAHSCIELMNHLPKDISLHDFQSHLSSENLSQVRVVIDEYLNQPKEMVGPHLTMVCLVHLACKSTNKNKSVENYLHRLLRVDASGECHVDTRYGSFVQVYNKLVVSIRKLYKRTKIEQFIKKGFVVTEDVEKEFNRKASCVTATINENHNCESSLKEYSQDLVAKSSISCDEHIRGSVSESYDDCSYFKQPPTKKIKREIDIYQSETICVPYVSYMKDDHSYSCNIEISDQMKMPWTLSG